MFNDSVVDDYFYMNNKSDPYVREYVDQENLYTMWEFEQNIELQKELYYEFIKSMPRGEFEELPLEIGDYIYFAKTPEDEDYEVWYRNSTSTGYGSNWMSLLTRIGQRCGGCAGFERDCPTFQCQLLGTGCACS